MSFNPRIVSGYLLLSVMITVSSLAKADQKLEEPNQKTLLQRR